MGHVDANHHRFGLRQPFHRGCIKLVDVISVTIENLYIKIQTYQVVHATELSVDLQGNVREILILFLWLSQSLLELHVNRVNAQFHVSNPLQIFKKRCQLQGKRISAIYSSP
jgi:hypothetical protein